MANTEKKILFDYELLDCGDGRRLEQFSDVIIDRPAPQAIWPKSPKVTDWKAAQAYYDRPLKGNSQWHADSVFPDNWQMQVDNIIIELQASSNNQVGIFPEQLSNWRWLTKQLQQAKRPVEVLNAFAYTGVATLTASGAAKNIEVCHVDGSKSAVAWAQRNAKLSGLQDRPIRWIVDDVMTFLKREVKRGRRYDAFILDPPAFGRHQGASWQLKRDLPRLMEYVNQLLSNSPCFVILSCHAPELTSNNLADMLEKLDAFKGRSAEALDLTIFSNKGNDLPSSICARI